MIHEYERDAAVVIIDTDPGKNRIEVLEWYYASLEQIATMRDSATRAGGKVEIVPRKAP
jgi:hypothetical protein